MILMDAGIDVATERQYTAGVTIAMVLAAGLASLQRSPGRANPFGTYPPGVGKREPRKNEPREPVYPKTM